MIRTGGNVKGLWTFFQESLGLGAEIRQLRDPKWSQLPLPLPPVQSLLVTVKRFGDLAQAVIAHGQEKQVVGSRLAFVVLDSPLQLIDGGLELSEPVMDHTQGIAISPVILGEVDRLL